VIFARHDDAVLKREFSYLSRDWELRDWALDICLIGRPDLDWVHLAKGHGSARRPRVTLLEAFSKNRWTGFESEGPTLIEVPLYAWCSRSQRPG